MNARPRLTVLGVSSAALLLLGGPASAHVHQICTPGNGDPVIQEEPFHGSTPGNAAEEHFLDNPNYGSRGFHPLHESLHLSEAAPHRAITVVVQGTVDC